MRAGTDLFSLVAGTDPEIDPPPLDPDHLGLADDALSGRRRGEMADVHARADLLGLLRDAVERTEVAVLYVCGDLEELWQNCHRVIVVRRGRVMGEVTPGRDDIGAAHGLMY